MTDTLQNMAKDRRPFQWNPAKEEAALLLSQDELTGDQIAEKLQIGARTLSHWKTNPEFMARVDGHINEFRARVRRRGIAILENRVAALQDRWDKMKRVIKERGESSEMQDVPGGKTGLIVRQLKKIGSGADAEIVEEFAVDTALLKEMREHEKQAAQELGQWSDKHEHDHGGAVQIEFDLTKLTNDELDTLRKIRERVTAQPNPN